MYGSPEQVAARARVWSDNGAWIDPADDVRGTNPSLATVNQWLEEVSAQMDIALKTNWFQAPISKTKSPRAYNAISGYVVALVAAQCHDANLVEREAPPQGKVMKDMNAWVKENSDGFLADGLTQIATPSSKTQVSFRVVGS